MRLYRFDAQGKFPGDLFIGIIFCHQAKDFFFTPGQVVDTGHNRVILKPLFIINPEGVKESLRAAGPVIGMMTGSKFKVQIAQLEPGDILIGYTDGVTEALSPEKELYTKKRFLTILENPAPTASELIDQIKADLFAHVKDAPQFDDITMLAIHREK